MLIVRKNATCCGVLDALQDLVFLIEFLRLQKRPIAHFVSEPTFLWFYFHPKSQILAKDRDYDMNTFATASSPAALTDATASSPAALTEDNIGWFCFDKQPLIRFGRL